MAAIEHEHIVYGPEPVIPLPRVSFGKYLYDRLRTNTITRDALIDVLRNKSISYQTIFEKSCRLALTLRNRFDYGPGTVLTICSENSLEYFIPVLAGLYIGATAAPLNQNYTLNELEHCHGISRGRIVFCSGQVAPHFVHLQTTTAQYIEKIVVLDADEGGVVPEGCCKLDDILWEGEYIDLEPLEIDLDDVVAVILCSSGTTGLPKGVMLTHTNLSVWLVYVEDPKYAFLGPSNTVCGLLPFFHGFGLILHLLAISVGRMIALLSRFEPHTFLRTIEQYQIVDLWLAPPILVFLAKSPLVEEYDLSCVQNITSGAAALNPSIEEQVLKRLKSSTLRQGYGMTEVSLSVTLTAIGVKRTGSVGPLLPFAEGIVRDPETGRTMAAGQIGELCFRGPMVMKGYCGDAEATKAAFTPCGKWIRSGDLGYYDEEEYFYVVDRVKELIKYKAFQVAPAELESVLLLHPGISDVGVVGIPDEAAGELPFAFVVKNSNNTELTEKEVQDFLAERVSSQKKLRGGVSFVKEIPKNASGKILRRELRQLANALKSNEK